MKALVIIIICIAGWGIMGPILANISENGEKVDYAFPFRKKVEVKNTPVETVNSALVAEMAKTNPALALQTIEEELDRIDDLRDTFEEYTDELFFQYTYLLKESKETEADYLFLIKQSKEQDIFSHFSYDEMSQVGKSLDGQRFVMSNVLQEYVDKRDGYRQGINNYVSLVQFRALLTRETETERLIGIEPNSTIEPTNLTAAPRPRRNLSKPFKETAFDKAISESESPKMATKLGKLRGKLLWPVIGRVEGGFGIEKDRANGTDTSNPGIEISTSRSAIVRVVHPGVVSDQFSLPRYGKIVIVDHTTFSSAYGNLENTVVSVGDSVDTRQELGRAAPGSADDTGMVFFGIFDGQGMQVNPIRYIKR